jgi:hypothetical protein
MKELLIKLRNQIKDQTFLHYRYGEGRESVMQGVGLCHELNSGIFSMAEIQELSDYILWHRPDVESIHFDPNYKFSSWYWEKGVVAPRIAWLEDEIKKLEK